MMSKKHYEMIAEVVRYRMNVAVESLPADSEARKLFVSAVAGVANELSNKFVIENPRFDRRRFLSACGVI